MVLGVELELDDRAWCCLDVVWIVLQAAVGVGDRYDLDDEFPWSRCLGWRRSRLPVIPASGIATLLVAAGRPPTLVATIPGCLVATMTISKDSRDKERRGE